MIFMRKKSTYVVLLVMLVTFFVVMFLAFGLGNIKKGKYTTTLLVGNDTVWTYSNKKWNNISKVSAIKEFNWNKFKVFNNNKEIGDYYLWHDDKWYAFDEKKNAIPMEGELLAYDANYDIDVVDFKEEEITDRTYVNKVLEENDLSISSKTTTETLVRVDYDKDGIEEEFYLISNVFALDFTPDITFSIVFMVKDDTIYYIYKDISTNKIYNGCMPYFTAFLDSDNDNNYEFVLSCARYSVSSVVKMLYKNENGKFKILISNQ